MPTDWEAYNRIVAQQEAEHAAWRNSDEGKATLAEIKRRADFVHDYIAQADDHARGYYLGLAKALTHAAQVAKTDVYTIEFFLEDAGYGYSPSGQQQRAEHFYGPEPQAAPDLVRHEFDPVLFLCLAQEWDEDGLLAWSLQLGGAETALSSINITCACTENDTGVPDDTDCWYAWEPRAAELRDRIAAIAKD